jgi:hypothetical protein
VGRLNPWGGATLRLLAGDPVLVAVEDPVVRHRLVLRLKLDGFPASFSTDDGFAVR